MSALTAEVYRRVCDVLFDDWDPIGVNAHAPRDEYDSYAAGLIRLIQSGADEARVAHRLTDLARESMGPEYVDEERDRRVARRLITRVRGV